MPKRYSSREIVKVLRGHGFTFVGQTGSHGKFRKEVGNKVLTTIVPMAKKEVPVGTVKGIMRQAALKEEDFK
jgi:predicted RNA binding protein YcfA (HicA-like mRNA interferase family)